MDPPASAYHHGHTPSTSTCEGRISPISDLPCRPPEVARLSYTLPSSSRHTGDVGYPILDEKHGISNYGNNMLSPPLQPGTSVSSAGGTSFMTGGTVDTVDLEKGAIEHQRQLSESRRCSKGKGKQEMAERRQHPYPSPKRYGNGHILPYDQQSVRSDVDEEQDMVEQRHLLKSKALNILVCPSRQPWPPHLILIFPPAPPFRPMCCPLFPSRLLLHPGHPRHLPHLTSTPLHKTSSINMGTTPFHTHLCATPTASLHLRPSRQHPRQERRQSAIQSRRLPIPEHWRCSSRMDRRRLLDLRSHCR